MTVVAYISLTLSVILTVILFLLFAIAAPVMYCYAIYTKPDLKLAMQRHAQDQAEPVYKICLNTTILILKTSR